MRTVGALLLAFFVSVFVAGIVQNQLAVAFGAGEEFIAVMMLFVLSAIVTTIAFGIALALSRSVAVIDWTALALLGLVVVDDRCAGPARCGPEQAHDRAR